MELVYTDKNHEVIDSYRVISCSKNLGDVEVVVITSAGKVALLLSNGLSQPNLSDFSLHLAHSDKDRINRRVNVVDSRVQPH